MDIRHSELGELQHLMVKELLKIYPEREALSIINVLFTSYFKKSRAGLVLEKDRKLSESEIFYFQRALRRLLNHEPVQYVTGEVNFMGHIFRVNPAVLIPRPETEELAQWIIDDYADRSQEKKILDIGTGSGCIAVSLKKALPHSLVHAIDNDVNALQQAENNAKDLKAEIHFSELDILNEEMRSVLPVFDIIVSNPPYVTPDDRKLMDPNVIKYEPEGALWVESDDPLKYYRVITEFSIDHLITGGSIYFECNEANAREVQKMLAHYGFHDIMLKKDLQGKDRMLRGIR